jgi:ribosomal protein L14
MQAEGRCPHSPVRYAVIVRQREQMARRDALLMREWERQGAA